MSTVHIGQALNAPADLSATERLVLVLLAEHANADGTTFTSVSQLARRANISPSTGTRTLRRLTEAGLVRQISVSTPAGASAGWRMELTGDNATESRA